MYAVVLTPPHPLLYASTRNMAKSHFMILQDQSGTEAKSDAGGGEAVTVGGLRVWDRYSNYFAELPSLLEQYDGIGMFRANISILWSKSMPIFAYTFTQLHAYIIESAHSHTHVSI